jgi:uncharacterized protein (TIGR03790 family)
MTRRWLPGIGVAAVLVGSLAQTAPALGPSDVLVVYSTASSAGTQIAQSYAQARPGVGLLGLQNVPAGEAISAADYLSLIRQPVAAALDQGDYQCIVTTKGLPVRIENPGSGAWWKPYSSLESELAALDRITTTEDMGNQNWLSNPSCKNPYYAADGAFDAGAYGTRLTARLDGFTVGDVQAAVGRAQQAVIGHPAWTVVLDDEPGRYSRMDAASQVVDAASVSCVYDTTDADVRDADGAVLAYVSHGVHGGLPSGYLVDEANGLAFDLAPGAVFHTYESYNAYSFEPGGNRAGQGLIAEWIQRGGTAGVGHVEEPEIGQLNNANEDQMLEMLLAGHTWAEAAWSSIFYLSFVNTVVGDPLMTLDPWQPGDLDFDGDVDMLDVTIVKGAYCRPGDDDYAERYDAIADFDGDGDVDMLDVTFVKQNYTGPLMQSPPPSGADSVPEPAVALVILIGAPLVLARRRRR